MTKTFYSLIQYCPDRLRAESVNIGLVIVCAESHSVRVTLSPTFDRARRLFRITDEELANLSIAAHAVRNRIEELRTPEDLTKFAATRGNDVRLTTPRVARIDEMEPDFRRLFSKLVE